MVSRTRRSRSSSRPAVRSASRPLRVGRRPRQDGRRGREPLRVRTIDHVARRFAERPYLRVARPHRRPAKGDRRRAAVPTARRLLRPFRSPGPSPRWTMTRGCVSGRPASLKLRPRRISTHAASIAVLDGLEDGVAHPVGLLAVDASLGQSPGDGRACRTRVQGTAPARRRRTCSSAHGLA